MNNKIIYVAYCVADRIDLVEYRTEYPTQLVSKSTTALYYQIKETKYLYLLSYGVVVFCGFTNPEIEDHLKRIAAYSIHPKTSNSRDELEVLFVKNQDHLELSFDTLTLGRFDDDVNKMIMMHLAQSEALDYFNGLSQGILRELKEYTQYLQIHGKVKLGHKKALKFIGSTLNTKNSIAENLYILDSPDTAWEDEYLDTLHQTLVRHFELAQRNREIDNTFKIIDDNLSVFMSYNHHRESSRLEWIIIILIVIEVLDTFVSKMF